MKKIGIVYAISNSAGELCISTLLSKAETLKLSDFSIHTHEHPAQRYKGASDEELIELLFSSIYELVVNKDAEVIIISANSVHRVFSEIQDKVYEKFPTVKMVSIVDATVEDVINSNIHKVAIFGSNSTIQSYLYQTPLISKGIEVLELDEEDQNFLNQLIKKGVDKDTSHTDREQLKRIAQKCKANGCKAVILACAELPIIFNAENLGIITIDTNEALARAAMNAATASNLVNGF